jgi:hypothetical protein
MRGTVLSARKRDMHPRHFHNLKKERSSFIYIYIFFGINSPKFKFPRVASFPSLSRTKQDRRIHRAKLLSSIFVCQPRESRSFASTNRRGVIRACDKGETRLRSIFPLISPALPEEGQPTVRWKRSRRRPDLTWSRGWSAEMRKRCCV